ncbi:VOC family protein [Chryseobacterium sp. NEB161]|nr:VOC family protein [Chryseobacterium sp. NEB161]
METIYRTYKPDGFHTVTTYLFVDKPQQLIDFLKSAFLAREINRSINPTNGDIANCILKIGDSCFMISQARDQFKGMRTALYLFVDNVDEMHQRAVENGAKVEFEPADMPYEDRQSGIIDPCGNYWWISKRLFNKGYHE